MDRMLYVAMSGAQQTLKAQTVHGNNLANVNTMGFRGDFVDSRAVPVAGDGFASRIFALTEGNKTNLEKGSHISTGNDLDIAIKGDGYIAVQAPDGTEAYTRAGALQIDASGRLLTNTGLQVLGGGGPISLPPFEKLDIGSDGTITIRELGQSPENLSAVDQIKLVSLDEAMLAKDANGLLRLTDGSTGVADGHVQIASGFLEGSNVNAIEEMVNVLTLTRQFEMQVKMMKTAEQNDASTARILQV